MMVTDAAGARIVPPSTDHARPALFTARATAATLNAVRYHGCLRRTFTVHCTRTPIAATVIARSAPSVTSTMKSTTYAIDMVEEPRPSGTRSLNSDTVNIAAT